MDHSKKLRNYAALAVASAAVMQVGCDKDEDNDDPNIEYKLLNKVINTAEDAVSVDSIDINNDGIFDFYFVGYRGVGTNVYPYMEGLRAGNEVLAEVTSFYTYNFNMPKNIPAGTDINASSTTWDYYIYFAWSYNGYAVANGINGMGDKFIGVRFNVGADRHYGWVRVNVSANTGVISIKDHAFHKVPNTGLKAGSK